MRFLPGQNFECSGCTKCCRGWRIRVDEASRPALERLQGLQKSDGRFFTKKKVDGSCVFLAEDQRCSVHEMKPVGCRQFPFRFCRTPDGVFVGVSFYCSAVQRNQGQPLELHAPQLEEFLHELPLIGAEPILVDQGVSLTWDGYRILDQFLADQLLEESLDVALGRALWTLCRLLLEGAPQVSEERLRRLLGESERVLQPPNEPFVAFQRHHACILLAKAEAVPLQRIQENKATHFRGLPRPLRLSELDEVCDESILRRYLQALVFRKFLIVRRPLLHNLAALYLVRRLFHWWAGLSRASRSTEESSSWQAVDYEKALDQCEYRILTHGAGYDEMFRLAALDFFWAASGK